MADLLKLETDELPDHVTALWEASGKIAVFLVHDIKLAANSSKDPAPLPVDLHRALDDLVRSLAPWVRQFPTARTLDESGANVAADSAQLLQASILVEVASRSGLIPDAAWETVRESVMLAGQDGAQRSKSAVYAVRGMRGLAARALSYAASMKAAPVGTHSPLIGPIGGFLRDGAPQIEALFAGYPADIRHASSRMMEDAGKREFPFVDTGPAMAGEGLAPSNPKPFPWAHRWGADKYGKWVSFAVPAADGALLDPAHALDRAHAPGRFPYGFAANRTRPLSG